MSEIKNIVLIDHEPFTRRRKDLFYIDEFIRAGFRVQVWDLSQLIFPGMKLADSLEEDYVVGCLKLSDVEDLLQKLDVCDTVFILEIEIGWKNRKILKLLSDYRCYTIKINLYGNNISLSKWENYFYRMFTKDLYRILKSKIYWLLFLFYKRKNRLHIFSKIFSSSAEGCFTDRINHPDFERYTEITKTSLGAEEKYIVFLDNYFPLHPDFKYFNSIHCDKADAEVYQASLRSFFSYLETEYGIPVVIAAHPKAMYKGDEFGDRKIIKYKTAELVVAAEVVVCHASNSISYAILADKPTLIISTNGYEAFRLSKLYLKKVAKVIGKEVYNIDNIPDYAVCKIERVQENIRENYIYNYLTSRESEHRRNIDILLRVIGDIRLGI